MKTTLYIKNMVCNRCVASVEQVLEQLKIPYESLFLGEVHTERELTGTELKSLAEALRPLGFELIDNRKSVLIEKVKKAVLDYVNLSEQAKKINLSAFISKELHYDYSYLSDLFSSIEGITIEQFFIRQRIEKVKELLVYDELSLSQIAFDLNYSSVHHLSAQFKKVTGLTPSHFKKIGAVKRKPLDWV